MRVNSQQREVIKRCQASAIWFMRNFVKVKHPGAGIIAFDPFGYQRDAVRSFRKHRFNIFRKCRQAGISKISGIFALWFALFSPHKTILIVSRTDADAMEFLNENVRLPFRNLPQWMQDLWLPKGAKDNEHAIEFSNGSKIRSLTSNRDVLRSNASSLNIIDEAAFIPEMDQMWAGARPTLSHGGSVIVISTCVAPNTYIWTANGMCQIKDLAPERYDGLDDGYYHADYDGPAVLGVDGLEAPSKFYKRSQEKTKKVTYSGGAELEASLLHKVVAVHDDGSIGQKLIQDLQVGDYVPIKNGAMVFGNDDAINYRDGDFFVETVTPELGYLVGVATAEGHLRAENITIACGDEEVLQRCMSWGDLHWFRRNGQPYVITCARWRFCRFLRWLGMGYTTAPHKQVPRRLWSCSEPIIRAFLRGLYDGDGSSRTRDGEICLTSTSKDLVDQVKQLLFNYGIMCRMEIKDEGITSFARPDGGKRVSKTKRTYRLMVMSQDSLKFYDLVGFGLERKQVNRSKVRPGTMRMLPPVVRRLLNQFRREVGITISEMGRLGIAPNVLFQRPRVSLERLRAFLDAVPVMYRRGDAYNKLVAIASYDCYLSVVDIAESEAEVYDFTMPRTHTFIANCTVNLNTNGVGNWYWNTWTDAEAGLNDFNPISVRWWDMVWRIEYEDVLSGQHAVICPVEGIRKCESKADMEKYGEYWSPWLEEQWRSLQEKGEGWKFSQEILAEFIGSGNTILPKSVIVHVSTTINDDYDLVTGPQTYVHPVSGEREDLDFTPAEPDQGLWIWRKPVGATPDKYAGSKLVEKGKPAHSYVMGVDISTGKARDYSAIEVFDIDEMEQVAELMIHCLPAIFKKMIDRIGRYYNTALAVVERNNGGDDLIDDLQRELMYPRLWRRTAMNDRPSKTPRSNAISYAHYGHFTSLASKPVLNKYLLDCIRDNPDEGFRIYSRRLYKQFQIYVRKKDRAGRDTGKTEAETGPGNFDDLVMATGLALIGVPDAVLPDQATAVPLRADHVAWTVDNSRRAGELHKKFVEMGGAGLLMPVTFGAENTPDESAQAELEAFANQLTTASAQDKLKKLPMVVQRKHQLK